MGFSKFVSYVFSDRLSLFLLLNYSCFLNLILSLKILQPLLHFLHTGFILFFQHFCIDRNSWPPFFSLHVIINNFSNSLFFTHLLFLLSDSKSIWNIFRMSFGPLCIFFHFQMLVPQSRAVVLFSFLNLLLYQGIVNFYLLLVSTLFISLQLYVLQILLELLLQQFFAFLFLHLFVFQSLHLNLFSEISLFLLFFFPLLPDKFLFCLKCLI